MRRAALIVATVLTALPGVAGSQVPSAPNFHHPSHNGEPSAHLDYGHGFADVSKIDVIQVRVTHGTERFTGRVMAARLFDSAGPNEFAAAVNGYRSVCLQVGSGRSPLPFPLRSSTSIT